MLVKYTVSEFLSAKGSFSSIDWEKTYFLALGMGPNLGPKMG